MEKKSWLSGPIELYKHSFKHLKSNTDFDFRISFISLDLCVEVSIKTFLSLNRRKLKISRNDIKKNFQNFPSLLDLIENQSIDLISTDQLDMIEFFHSIRNKLYHSGTGVTVERKIVEVYGALVRNIISSLFDIDVLKYLDKEEIDVVKVIGEFLMKWAKIEKFSRKLGSEDNKFMSPIQLINILQVERGLADDFVSDFHLLRKFRNDLVHGISEPDSIIIRRMDQKLDQFLIELQKLDVDYTK